MTYSLYVFIKRLRLEELNFIEILQLCIITLLTTVSWYTVDNYKNRCNRNIIFFLPHICVPDRLLPAFPTCNAFLDAHECTDIGRRLPSSGSTTIPRARKYGKRFRCVMLVVANVAGSKDEERATEVLLTLPDFFSLQHQLRRTLSETTWGNLLNFTQLPLEDLHNFFHIRCSTPLDL